MKYPIKAVTFDAAGTLFEIVEPVGITYSRIARARGVDACPDALDRAFRTLWLQVPPPHETQGGVTGEFDGHHAERRWWKDFVAKVFISACGEDNLPPPKEFAALFENLFEHFAAPSAWRLMPDALEVLETVHRDRKTGIVSNFDRRFYGIARGLGLEPFFDTVILSATIGASKPDPAIFFAAAKDLGCDPSEILHVGDDPLRDWQGAKAAGFQVYRLDSLELPLKNIPGWVASRQ